MAITEIIKSSLFEDIPNITHGFGVRGVGVAQYLDELGVRDRFIVETNQTHGNDIHCLFRPRKGGVLQGDAFITDRPGLVCFVRTADCVPMLIADPKKLVIAAVHAGWRGTVKDVAGKTVEAMITTYNCDPKDLIAAVGPRICANCFEVGEEVIKDFSILGLGDDWMRAQNKIDLGAANRTLLKRAGVPDSNIDVLPHCTFCDEHFASYRRDKSEEERQFNFIVIK